MTNKRNSCNCSDCSQQSGQDYGLTSVRFVGIEFDPKKINSQQNELNGALKQNWQLIKDIQTETGLVFILGKFGRLNSDEQDELPEFGRKDIQEISNKQSVFDPAEAIRRTSRISPEEEEALRNTVNDDRRCN